MEEVANNDSISSDDEYIDSTPTSSAISTEKTELTPRENDRNDISDQLITTEEKRLKEIRQKQSVLLEQIKHLNNVQIEIDDKEINPDLKNRLIYLAQQAEMYSLFMQGVFQLSSSSKSRDKQSGRQRSNRLTEEEEDNILRESEKANYTRLTQQPKCITGGEMKPYQLEALNWLISLYNCGINGILADEMGLGKTLETISIFAYLNDYKSIAGPHLVIVPKSTLGNWETEIKRWCPHFRVLRFHGTISERVTLIKDYIQPRLFDICVTTYETVNAEKNALGKIQWIYLCIDEAHRIKNECSMLSQTVRFFTSFYRLLITGTPLQNNLHELWALLNFLLPDLFNNSSDFDSIFVNSSENSFISKLHTILRPFILRRLKSDVATDLPQKIETKLYIGLSEMQRNWYQNVLKKDVAALNQLGGASRVQLLNILMQLKKVCNHPYLFEGAEPGPPYTDGPHIWENSGKMVLLNKLLPKLKLMNSRVLIFCQMTRMLDILEDYLRYCSYLYCRIDGQTSGEIRDSQINSFNEPGSEYFIFLLSTRAGGLGINLATADVVILYDSDWNPQSDLQAQDRCHRIGQKKQVRVFRFITEGTVEEKIIERAERKLYLDAVVIQQGRLVEKDKKLGTDELNSMITFGADQIFNCQGSTITDNDIDCLLTYGESKTKILNEKIKSGGYSLKDFTFDHNSEFSIYSYDGMTYKNGKSSSFINIGKRRNNSVGHVVDEKEKKARRLKEMGLHIYDFQFIEEEKIVNLLDKENNLQNDKKRHLKWFKDQLTTNNDYDSNTVKIKIQEESEKVDHLYILSPEEQAEKDRLLGEGFPNWNKNDFRKYIGALERYGRNNKQQIFSDVSKDTGKAIEEVERYHNVFWMKYQNISDSQKLLERISKAELKLDKKSKAESILQAKVNSYKNPKLQITVNYGNQKGKFYSDHNDRFLLYHLYNVGYGNWDSLKHEIQKSQEFRFDWYFKSRSVAEIQRRCDLLIKLIEKESDGSLYYKTKKRSHEEAIKTNTSHDIPIQQKKLKSK